MVSKILICTLFLLTLLATTNGEYWKQKKFSQVIKGKEYAIHKFDGDAEIIHFNVTCSRPCNIFLMNEIDYLRFQEESNFTDSFKELETTSSTLTVVNFRNEKQFLVVHNTLNQEISTFCILKEHKEKQKVLKNSKITPFTILYIIIFAIISYFMNKNFKN